MRDAIGFRQQLSTISVEASELEMTVNYPVHIWTQNDSLTRNLMSWSVETNQNQVLCFRPKTKPTPKMEAYFWPKTETKTKLPRHFQPKMKTTNKQDKDDEV